MIGHRPCRDRRSSASLCVCAHSHKGTAEATLLHRTRKVQAYLKIRSFGQPSCAKSGHFSPTDLTLEIADHFVRDSLHPKLLPAAAFLQPMRQYESLHTAATHIRPHLSGLIGIPCTICIYHELQPVLHAAGGSYREPGRSSAPLLGTTSLQAEKEAVAPGKSL